VVARIGAVVTGVDTGLILLMSHHSLPEEWRAPKRPRLPIERVKRSEIRAVSLAKGDLRMC
jgi:hypothetical protein